MREIGTLPFVAFALALALWGCANRRLPDRVTSCTTSVLPRYRACIERVAHEFKQCDANFRFLARHSCQKKLSLVELTEEQVKQSAAGCRANPSDRLS